jgi:uncharacterized protein YlxP (DUF503 family)
MIVGIVVIELYLPFSRSLKEKRKEIRSIKEKLRSNFNVSVAEIDNQNLWQRASLGISIAGSDTLHLQESVDKIIEFIERNWSHLLLEVRRDMLKV